MNLYLDFDGVIVDSIKVTYKMMEEKGISIEDTPRVREFYRDLDWFKLLNNINQLSNSIRCIKKLQEEGTYNLYILTTVNSLDEIEAKLNYVRGFGLNIPIISVPKGVNKNDVVEAKNNILVDDYSGNLYAWESAGGIGVKFSEENKKQQGFITVNSLGELNHTKFMKRLIKRL